MSADVQFSAQKQVKTKNKVIMSANVHFSAQKPVKIKKKRSSPPQAVICTEAFQNFSVCFHRS